MSAAASSLPAPEAVIVAGGFGTRLRPLTTRRPKHLLEVGGVPFLEHQIARLAAAGVAHVVLATSYRADLFRPVLGDGDRWGIRLDCVQEEEPLGTAGAIRNVAGALGDDPDAPVVILNGDILSGHDLHAQLADFARPRDGRPVDVSLHLVTVTDARPFGCVPTDEHGRVTGFLEKSEHPVTDQINAGCYVFDREVIDAIPSGRVVSVERETFPNLLASGVLVLGYVVASYWLDIGTPAAYVQASRDVVTGALHSAALPGVPGGFLALPGADVDPSAVVERGTCVGLGARVAAGAVVSGAVLLDGAYVGDSADIGARNELRGGLRVWPDTVLAPGTVRFSSDVGQS
jgi:mannose-1-phosphate guanylyltransferase